MQGFEGRAPRAKICCVKDVPTLDEGAQRAGLRVEGSAEAGQRLGSGPGGGTRLAKINKRDGFEVHAAFPAVPPHTTANTKHMCGRERSCSQE